MKSPQDMGSITERVVSGKTMPGDGDADNSLRPRSLGEYIGQEKIKENLSIFVEAASKRGRSAVRLFLAARFACSRPAKRAEDKDKRGCANPSRHEGDR